MTQSLLKSVLKLSKAERILLAERLWDSVVDDDATIALTKPQQAELEKRLARIAATGAQGSGWTTVRARITRRAKR
jgi:putative addiction module component (TIGR02574 family)